METQNIGIFSSIVTWCGSLTGIITLFIVFATANRILLTLIREKKGKDTTFYRNSKLISGMLYLIFFVNCFGAIGRRIASTGSSLLSMPSMATTALITICILLVALSCKRDSVMIWIMSIVVFSAGFQLIYQDVTLMVAVTAGYMLASLLIMGLCALVVDGTDGQTQSPASSEVSNVVDADSGETQKQPLTLKGWIMIAVWAMSVVAAYMAGEYSLVSKAIDYAQKRFSGHNSERKAKTEEKGNTEIKAEVAPT